MSRIMLIDAAHAEETRVAIVNGRQVEEFDFESHARRQLRGNIYLAKVTRVEPSLQAAFVEYGGNRHGFLAFNEIHPDYYQIPVADREAIMAEADDDADEHLERDSADDEVEGGPAEEERLKRRLMRRYKIQDVIKRRQILLVQVVKDERGAKGAALTTWLSLAGRYCVLMPNTGKGGGISRKITNAADRKRLKAAASSLEVPSGMGLIIRTAGAKRTKAEIKRDYEYLLRLWETIRETTLASNAPSLIYEEENLVRRAVRDMFDKDFDGIQVEGVQGFKEARDFMRVLMPSQLKKVHLYQGTKPLFAANGIEEVLHQIHQPVVPLKSGGYLVINQTEALVAIDVNSGRATKERNVEATATKTNLEAAVEAARQLRLRDLAGLIVIDFIDMEESKNNRAVEKALKDALATDRARIQMGKISMFGLMEISRQRRRIGVLEGATEACPHCQGSGRIRSAESAALVALRAVDIEAGKLGAGAINLRLSTAVALYVLNHKREYLQRLLDRRGLSVTVLVDDSLAQGEHSIERTETNSDFEPASIDEPILIDDGEDFDALADFDEDDEEDDEDEVALDNEDADDDEARQRLEEHVEDSGRGRRRRRGGRRDAEDDGVADKLEGEGSDDEDDGRGRRRRGRRGGRRIREEGVVRDGFVWVRARTPDINDPYVWFDPLNPESSTSAHAPAQHAAPESEEHQDDRSDVENGGDRGGRRRRRRGGRGRGSLNHEVKVEARATNEGMPPEGSPETPMAVIIAEDAEGETTAPVRDDEAAPSEPRRRRVRRKTVVETVDLSIVEPNETEPEAIPVELDVEPAVAAVIEQAIAAAVVEPAPIEIAEAAEPPKPEIDVAALVADDPNQVTGKPAKARKGWWRR